MRRVVLFVALATGCEHEPDCQGLTLTYNSPDSVHFVDHDGKLGLFALDGFGAGWYPVRSTGAVEPPELANGLFAVPAEIFADTLFERPRLVTADGGGFRIITDDHVAHLDGDLEGDAEPLVADTVPNTFAIEQAWVIGGTLWVAWAAPDPVEVGTWRAGLGQVDSEDNVHAIGDLFYRGPGPTRWPARLGLYGGWDASNGWFWIDVPDPPRTVLKIASDGTVLDQIAYGGTTPSLRDWNQLPSGHWLGLAGGTVYEFMPDDRSTATSLKLVDSADAPYTGSSTLFTDRGGRTWAAAVQRDAQIVLRRWERDAGTFGPEVWSPLAVPQCDFVLSPR